MFTLELTRGPDHAEVLKIVPLDVASLDRAIEAARARLTDAGAEGADGYRIRYQNGYFVASRWAGQRHS